MDIYIILDIVLKYHCEILQWSTARVLNKKMRQLVDSLAYDRDVSTVGTFMRVKWCVCCKKHCDTQFALYYPPDHRAHGRIITYCSHWFCKISAICTMLEELNKESIHVMRKPFLLDSRIDITRSNGEKTKATVEQTWVVEKEGTFTFAQFGTKDSTNVVNMSE